MAPHQVLTPSPTTAFAVPSVPASAVSLRSHNPPTATTTATTTSTCGKKRRARGEPAAIIISDYAKLASNYVRIMLESDMPAHVQEFRTKTEGKDISVEEEFKSAEAVIESLVRSNTSENKAKITTELRDIFFPKSSRLRRNDLALFTTWGMPANPRSHALNIAIKNPCPDILYGYGGTGIAVVVQAQETVGSQVLQTSDGVLCGSFPVEFKSQAKGGTTWDAFAQLAGALAACLHSFRIIRQKLLELGYPCDGLKNLVFPGIALDEFTAHEAVGWYGDDQEVRVAISAVHSMRTAEGMRAVLRRIRGTFDWLENEHFRTVESVLRAFEG